MGQVRVLPMEEMDKPLRMQVLPFYLPSERPPERQSSRVV